MSWDQGIGIAFLAGLVVAAVVVIWLCVATANEAERRLGRELYAIEIILAAAAFPYSLAMIWFVMPDKTERAP